MQDVDKIDEMFLDSLYSQLLFEKINIEFKTIAFKLGKIKFQSTNNNRKVIGILNYNIEKLNYFKYEYPVFNSSVIREMTEKLNKTPFKQLDWKLPFEAMNSLLSIDDS